MGRNFKSNSKHVTALGATDVSQSVVRDEDDKHATRTFNIFQLNINATQKKKNELQYLLTKNNIHPAKKVFEHLRYFVSKNLY